MIRFSLMFSAAMLLPRYDIFAVMLFSLPRCLFCLRYFHAAAGCHGYAAADIDAIRRRFDILAPCYYATRFFDYFDTILLFSYYVFIISLLRHFD